MNTPIAESLFKKDEGGGQSRFIQTIDKETEQLIKRIERAARTVKRQRLSQEECHRRYYDLITRGRDQEVEIESARPLLSLREQYGPKSAAWAEGNFPPIVRFWTDDDTCWGVPFHQVVAMNYNPRAQTLLIHWSLGSILVTGPKAEAFFERFCEHKVALVKADGKDVIRIEMAVREGRSED